MKTSTVGARAALLAVTLLSSCAGERDRLAPRAPVGAASFVGSYRGELRGAGPAPVPMALDVAPCDGEAGRFHWRMRYADQPVRDYVLVVTDAASGRCAIDERNGIVLPARIVGDELVAAFRVAGAVLVTRYRLTPDGVEFALESFDPDAGQDAGGGVRAFPAPAIQRALLRRR